MSSYSSASKQNGPLDLAGRGVLYLLLGPLPSVCLVVRMGRVSSPASDLVLPLSAAHRASSSHFGKRLGSLGQGFVGLVGRS